MGWKATGQPTASQQRGNWVVRVDGIDTETGRVRPRQLGTFPSKRAATIASRSLGVEDSTAAKDTVGRLVRRYIASKTDVSLKAREQYSWAARHRGRHRRVKLTGGDRACVADPLAGACTMTMVRISD